MRVVKRTDSTLVLSNLSEVRRRRKASFFLLLVNLLILTGFFWFLPVFNSNLIKLIASGLTFALLLPGILLIRFNTSESDYFSINTYNNNLIHKRRLLFAGKSYVANYSLNNLTFISVSRNAFNSDDGKDYKITLHFKSKKYKNRKYKQYYNLNLGYFTTKEKSLKIAIIISKFLKIPLKLK